MSTAANDDAYSVQKFRGAFALVQWWLDHDDLDEDGNPRRKRKRTQLTATDRASAEAEARRLWEDADDSPWTVGRIMTAYMATIVEKPSHQRRQDAWKAMKSFWANVDPALIDEKMVEDFTKVRRVAPATLRYELLQLSTALGWATGNGPKLASKPTIPLPEQPERKLRHLSHEEFEKFYAGVVADHARLYVMLGLYTMARPTAILELTWDRVDFMRRIIDFTPPGHRRTNKRRTIVPINDELLEALQKGHAGRTTPYVIERGGKRVACIKKAFLSASERSTVHATAYTLRHTGAVWAAEAGVSMAELAQFMGHDDDRTTQKYYARFSPDHLRSVASALKRKVQGSK